MAFSIQYTIKSLSTSTGTATSLAELRNAIQIAGPSLITQCTLSGTAEGSISELFKACSQLKTLDVSNLDTSNVTSMSQVFKQCSSLTSLDLSNWNTSSVTDMSYMFSGCNKVTTLDLSSFNTSNVTNMVLLFDECSTLQHIYVGDNWDVSNVTNSNGMFASCSSLPNYSSSYTDKTKAHYNTDGYLEYKAPTPTPTVPEIYIGGTAISAIKIGDTEISKIYLGTEEL